MSASINHTAARSAAPLLLCAAVLAACGAPAVARQTGGGFVECAEALRETIRSGRPTVVVVTSRAAPGSLALRDAIARDLLASSVGRLAMFAEMPVELYADRVDRLGIRRFPTLLAYGGRGGALERLGQCVEPSDSAQVAAWIGALGLSMAAAADPPTADPAVARSGFLHRDRGQVVAVPSPSPQQPPMPPPPAAPPKPLPPSLGMIPAAPAAPPAMSTVIAQEAGPPVVVQPQSPSIFIQPQAPRILLGQMPPPEITIVQAPPGAPTVHYATLGAPPAQAPPNLFAVPQQAGLPSPQGTIATAPDVAYAYAAPPATTALMATAPASGLAVAPQQSVVATTAIALLLQNPDVLNAMIGALGKGFTLLGHALEKHGHPRVRLPDTAPPPSQGTLTLVPGLAVPPQPAAHLMAVPVPQAAPPPLAPAVPAYPAAVPSPQSAPAAVAVPAEGRPHGGPWWKRR